MKRLLKFLFPAILLFILFFTLAPLKNNAWAAAAVDCTPNTNAPCGATPGICCYPTYCSNPTDTSHETCVTDPTTGKQTCTTYYTPNGMCTCNSILAYTNKTTGVCTYYKTYGQSCDGTYQCKPNLGLNCIDSNQSGAVPILECLCSSGYSWDQGSGKCVSPSCTQAAICGTKNCGLVYNKNCNLTVSCSANADGSCSGANTGYTCNLKTNKCEPPTCQSFAPAGGDGECVANNNVCHQAGGIITSSGNAYCKSQSAATQTCCTWSADANRGGYDCTQYGCVVHTGTGTGAYTSASDCTATHCRGGGTDCAVCPSGYTFNSLANQENQKCTRQSHPDIPALTTSPTYQSCSSSQCVEGVGCGGGLGSGFTNGQLPCTTTLVNGKYITTCPTAFGNFSTDSQGLVSKIFSIILSIAGGIATLLIIYSAYKLIVSQGNPEKTKDAQEQLTAAIVGLVLIIFTFTLMNFIGVDILNIFNQ